MAVMISEVGSLFHNVAARAGAEGTFAMDGFIVDGQGHGQLAWAAGAVNILQQFNAAGARE